MKKFDKNSAIGFGAIMTVFYLVQNFISLETFTSKNIIIAIITSLLTGLFAGLLFGLIIGWFKKSKFTDYASSIALDENESIKLYTPANHFKGLEGVGGILFLTNKRLYFKSHKINIQVHELTIPKENIKEAFKHKTLGIINNGLTVITSNGQKEKFVVEKVNEWIKELG